MLQVLIDKKQIPLLQPIPKFISIEVEVLPIPVMIDKELVIPIAEWVYELTQRAVSISYNGTILTKDQVKNPKDIKRRP